MTTGVDLGICATVTTIARPLELDRNALLARYRENRARTEALFSLVTPEAYYDRPIDLRHPIVFYEGHIPAFSFNKLVHEALGEGPVDAALQKLFYRGIDPSDTSEAAKHQRANWPSRAAVREFGEACDRRVEGAVRTADLTDARRSTLLERGEAALTILEHEELHHETLLYMLYRLPYDKKIPDGRMSAYDDRSPLATGRVRVDAGTATLGAEADVAEFTWDNERGEHRVDVGAFDIDVNDITNGDWLAFVEAGGPVPQLWVRRGEAWFYHAMFEEIPLPLAWPVLVSQSAATAYATWRGARLPTEAEYHRAAFGTPEGTERAFPWGDARPSGAHGNLDLRRYDVEPVGIHEAGRSAWGVYDLVGNGWEWTSTPFAPFDGFAPMATYPEYSADFFDGEHYVIKGASPVTNANHVRRSMRNWYRADYPYVFATFRTVVDR